MKTLLTSILVVMLATLIASPASADIYFYDNFDADDDGTLTGQTANTGETWAEQMISGIAASLDVGASYGSYGKGAGRSDVAKANSVAFGETTSGVIDFWADLSMAGNNGPQLWLHDSVNGTAFGLYNGHQGARMGTENFGLAQEWDTGMPTATAGILRQKLTIDLGAKTINLEWWGLGSDSGVHGTRSIGTYTAAFAPNRLEISVSAPSGVQGYDNLFVATGGTTPPVVPEPSTLALLATGLLGLVCYAWRKRK